MITEACAFADTVKNTGKECDVAMGPTAMLIALPKTISFTLADMVDPTAWLTTLIHAARGSRAYPLFGQQAPVRVISNNDEADVIETLDDGSKTFIRSGFYNRILKTTSGGLCYAQALYSFTQSGYRFLEVDQNGRMVVRDNKDAGATLAGLICDFMQGVRPDLADFKTSYKNGFGYSFSPLEMINNGKILQGASEILDIMGLIDVAFKIKTAPASSTTILRFDVMTECAKTNMATLFPTALPTVSNFVVTRKSTGGVITPSSAAIFSGYVQLVGTYISGQTYVVTGAPAATWRTNGIEGYDAEDATLEITIP